MAQQTGSSRGTVSLLRVRVVLGDAGAAIKHAQAAVVPQGAEWRHRLSRYEQGEALPLEVIAHAVIEVDSKPRDTVWFCHEIISVDRPITRGGVAKRVAALVRRDFRVADAHLRDRGVCVAADEPEVPVQISFDEHVIDRIAPG